MSRQLNKATVESERQPTLSLTKSTRKSVVDSFFQSSQQRPDYKFGSAFISKSTSSFGNEAEKDCYKKPSQKASKNEEAAEVARVLSNEEEKEMTCHLENSTYLSISKGLVNGLNKPKSQMSENVKDSKSMSIVEEACRKQLLQNHLSVIEAMELLELNADQEIVKQAMDQLFQLDIVRPPSEIEVWGAHDAATGASLMQDDRTSGDIVKEKGSEILDITKEGASQLKDRAEIAAGDYYEQGKAKGAELAEEAKEKGAEYYDQAKEKGSEYYEQAKEKGADLYAQGKQASIDKYDEFKENASEYVGDVKQSMQQKSEEFKEEFKEKATEVQHTLTQTIGEKLDHLKEAILNADHQHQDIETGHGLYEACSHNEDPVHLAKVYTEYAKDTIEEKVHDTLGSAKEKTRDTMESASDRVHELAGKTDDAKESLKENVDSAADKLKEFCEEAELKLNDAASI